MIRAVTYYYRTRESLTYSGSLVVRSVVMWLALMATVLASANVGQQVSTLTSYVDPFVGTGKSIRPSIWEANGGTYPGATLPFGMVQVTPENYRYDIHEIRTFSLINHTSGYPKGSSGDFHIMPVSGKLNGEVVSRFKHESESAEPGYYSVHLSDYDIFVELTATTRTGLLKFTFAPATDAAVVLQDLESVTIAGADHITGKSGGFFYSAKFSRPFYSPETIEGGLRVKFTAQQSRVVMVKVGFSTTSVVAAINNRRQEIAGWDFAAIKKAAASTWHKQLQSIVVQGGSEEQTRLFYTALYHSFLDPHIISDVDAAVTRYSGLSPWDTFRSKQPLLILLEPQRQRDMINSVLQRYQQAGQLPTGPMTGSHNIAIIADSYVKGVTDFDAAMAYQAMHKALLQPPYAHPDFGAFLRHGYVPSQASYSVTKTLEYAYDYWAMAQMAKALGKHDDYRSLSEKAGYYRALFNPAQRFMTAKSQTGEWDKGGYREGDKWAYNWFVPHDIQGLINLSGGDEAFAAMLQSNFADGHYVHDNEPPLHQAYLFNYAGKPWLTQYWVRKLLTREYALQPGGLPGNDDLGALSAWYVFSAMGFYPVTPGSATYVIGSPAFDNITINLPGDKRLLITADNLSDEHYYIQSSTFNDQALQKTWIKHSDIVAGGHWHFHMAAAPEKSWGSKAQARPPSMTAQMPSFAFSGLRLSEKTISADQALAVTVDIENTGAADGSARVDLSVDQQHLRTQWVLVKAGQKVSHSQTLKLYKPVAHKIAINQLPALSVRVKADRKAKYAYSDIQFPSPALVKAGTPVKITGRVKNVGSFAGNKVISLSVDGKITQHYRLPLQPGEQKKFAFTLNIKQKGVYDIAVGDLPAQKMLVYSPGMRSGLMSSLAPSLQPVMAFSFDEGPGESVRDSSALANHGVVHGKVKWVESIFGKAIATNAEAGAYISIPEHPDYKRIGNAREITMMMWVMPHDEENFADIISKGDYHVLQVRASNTEINYYSNHWSHGEAYSLLPQNWNRNWHHVAGVSDGKYHRLYVDGRLLVSKLIEFPERFAGSLDYPWNIGRNAENPERVFRGYIDEVVVFDRALSADEINRLMLSVEK